MVKELKEIPAIFLRTVKEGGQHDIEIQILDNI
jgi:hypothetical protein